jgi:hypothetical protein
VSAGLRRVLLPPALGIVAWILVAELAVPRLIAALHGDAELGARLAALGRAQAEHGLAHWLAEWSHASRWVAAGGVLYLLVAAGTLLPRAFASQAVGATPATLGAIRIVVCGVAALMTAWEDLASSALLPREMVRSMGIVDLLYALPVGFDRFVTSATALGAFRWLTLALLVAGALGWRTRLVLPLAAAAWLVLGGIQRHYAWLYHTGLIPTYLLFVLSLTPCGDGLSLDRRRRVRLGLPVVAERPAPIYGWSRFACWFVLALPYVEAGLMKLRRGGFDWWRAENLRGILHLDNLEPMQFDWGLWWRLAPAPDAALAGLGLGTLALEIGFGLVLVSRLARRVLPPAMAGLHLAILALQNVLFLDLIVLQSIFFDLTSWRRRPAREARTLREAPAPPDWPRRLRLVGAVLLGAWSLRLELFPLTAMQVYASPERNGVVEYHRLLAHYESGGTARLRPERWIGALADTRYRRVLRRTFESEEGRRTGDAFLAACARAHARRAPADALAALEVQRWRWDFRSHPGDARHGAAVARHVHAVKGRT